MTAEKGDDEFVSCLNEASKKKAKDELFERNDEDRKSAVMTFRQWVLQQDWLTTPTDFQFLLRFLRVRKFSQLGARETLENFWTIRSKRLDCTRDIDPADPVLQEILRSKMYYSPKKYDKDGCRWIFSAFGNQSADDITKWGFENILRVMVLFTEWICQDENVQVNGVRWLLDLTGQTMASFMKYSNPDDQKFMNSLFQKAVPMRIKAFYFYNEPTFFDVIYGIFSVFSRKKMLDRMHMIGKNMTTLYDQMDKSVLPREYLPDDHEGPCAGSEKQLIEEMIADMMTPAFRNHMKEVTSSKYGVDLSKRKKADDEPAQSFRKLNVD